MAYSKDYNVNPEDTDVATQSKINAAGLINSALENLWQKCYIDMANGNLVRWNRILDAIWTILGGDVVEGDDKDKQMEEINMSLYKTGSLNHKKSGFASVEGDESVNMALQYLILKNKSLFLRRLQNSQGKGTAYINEDEDDFD